MRKLSTFIVKLYPYKHNAKQKYFSTVVEIKAVNVEEARAIALGLKQGDWKYTEAWKKH